jgi:sulfite exporter TauE/SafE/copper chaperone CopZ
MTKLRTEIYKVGGMSCAACEAAVEKVLRGMDGIDHVKADFSGNTVTVTYDPGRVGTPEISSAVEACGYTLETGASAPVAVGAAKTGRVKQLTVPQFVGVVVILVALYLIVSSTAGFGFIPEVRSSMGYGVLFLVGLLTSLHCVAMCGGINMSQCTKAAAGASLAGTTAKIRPSLLYNLGRVTSYTVIGGLAGALGSVISFTGWARGIVAVVSGLFMIILGLSMTGLFPWINKITPRLPRAFRVKAGQAGKGKGPYIVGLLNGLMPCGPLQAMQLYALGTGSFIAGAASMLFFSLGTVPLMFGLGAVVTILGGKFTKKMMKVSAVLVAVLGIVMLGRGLTLSGVPLPSFKIQPSLATDDNSAGQTSVADGVQNITSVLEPGSYPAITVKKGIPVVWNITAEQKNINGCNRTLVIPKYDIQVTFKPGDNIIKFTPEDTGTIPYSCWMGMIDGQIRVVDTPGASPAPSALEEKT